MRTLLLSLIFAVAAGAVPEKVVEIPVRQDGLVATLLRPVGEERRPGLIVLGGSEGGIRSAEWLARRFAEYGWASLAVAYFGVQGLPSSLADIPLEYFDRAVAWLSAEPLVESGGIAIVSSSRGAELAFLVAAY